MDSGGLTAADERQIEAQQRRGLGERVEALEDQLRWALLALRIYVPEVMSTTTELGAEFRGAAAVLDATAVLPSEVNRRRALVQEISARLASRRAAVSGQQPKGDPS